MLLVSMPVEFQPPDTLRLSRRQEQVLDWVAGRTGGLKELEAALRAVGLAYLIDQLDVDGNWAQRLSGGEQQRVGFARILLVRPEIVFLDEATSALDEAAEASLYRLVREADWHPTIVSVGHHGTLRRFHEAIVDLGRPPVSHAAAAGD